MLLTREAILQADDLLKELVPTPEWERDGYVYVRVMTGIDRETFETHLRDQGTIRAWTAVLTVCDAEGQLLFTHEDLAALCQRSFLPLDRIFEVARRLNALTAEEVEALAKNSRSDQSDDSGLDSLSVSEEQ
jgi:hypothetical protein